MKNSCDNNKKCTKCSSYSKPGSPCVYCEEVGCEVIYTTDCVVYVGNELECYGISSGDTLTTVILKLLMYVFPECHTTTTSSTTTTSTTTSTTTTTVPVTTTTTEYRICDIC